MVALRQEQAAEVGSGERNVAVEVKGSEPPSPICPDMERFLGQFQNFAAYLVQQNGTNRRGRKMDKKKQLLPKRIGNSDLIGERGVALVYSRIVEMGYPPMRGTFLQTEVGEAVCCTRGAVCRCLTRRSPVLVCPTLLGAVRIQSGP